MWTTFKCLLKSRAALQLEILALRQQIAALQRRHPRPRLHAKDRIFWVWLSTVWSGWRDVLVIVRPETVVRWHRLGFRLYWRWKSRGRRPGRPELPLDVRRLKEMSMANITWGAPRIRGELAKLGIDVAESTVARYIPRRRKPPSPTWRSFLKNHTTSLICIDFFTVPTASFRVLYVFIVMNLDRRRVLHFNVTEHPSAQWTAQQVVEALPWDRGEVRYLLRDRDQTYGKVFQKRVKGLGLTEVLTAPRSPWQNPYVERLIGSIRRECLDHVIVLGEQHLRNILHGYFRYYHRWRTHLSLNGDAPEGRTVQGLSDGRVMAIPEVGGLHHRYVRRAG